MIDFLISKEDSIKLDRAITMIQNKINELTKEHPKSDHILQVIQTFKYIDKNKFQLDFETYTQVLARFYKYLNDTKFTNFADLCIYFQLLEPYYKFNEYYLFNEFINIKIKLTKQ